MLPVFDLSSISTKIGKHYGRACCRDATSWHGFFSVKLGDHDIHSLTIENGTLMLGADDAGSVLQLVTVGPDKITLCFNGSPLGLKKDGTLAIGNETVSGSFVRAESVGNELVKLRTSDGQYLVAASAKQVVSLASKSEQATIFELVPDRRFVSKWSADATFPFDPKHSTHLWIFQQALNAVCGTGSLGTQPLFTTHYDERDRAAFRMMARNTTFIQGISQGIYDADNAPGTTFGPPSINEFLNSSYTNSETSGFIFSAHFWHVVENRGGWWDPNRMVNAYEYGCRYLKMSVDSADPYVSGRYLGLAIHYLEDLTQPMHCGGYPNVPKLGGAALAAAQVAAPEPLPNLIAWTTPAETVVPIVKDNYRHEIYEQWVLDNQDKWAITPADLDKWDWPVDLPYKSNPSYLGATYYRKAGGAGLEIYRDWIPDPDSPIGKNAQAQKGEDAPSFANEKWSAATGSMLKLAQRLVINLLLTWASAAKVTEALETLPLDSSKDFLILDGLRRIVTPGRDQDRNVIFSSSDWPVGNDEWILQPALDGSGNQMRDQDGGRVGLVYLLRSRQTGWCIVAGDNYDGHVYHQADEGRRNALWALFPVASSGAEGARQQFQIRDLKHHKWLWIEAPNSAGMDSLRHGDTRDVWTILPRDYYP